MTKEPNMSTTTLADRIAASFGADPATQTERTMISILLANPGAKAGELALKMGWDDWSTWNLHFGTMCKRRFGASGVPTADDGTPFYSDVLINFEKDEDDGAWLYRLKEEAIEALASVLIAEEVRRVMGDVATTVRAEAKRKVRKGVGSY
jgi:hypothetical protein